MSMLPSSAACERNFSQFEHTYSRERNRLHNDRVHKLVAVKSYLQLNLSSKRNKKVRMTMTQQGDNESETSDSENDYEESDVDEESEVQNMLE